MTVAALITGGVGPGSTIPLAVTFGLGIGEEVIPVVPEAFRAFLHADIWAESMKPDVLESRMAPDVWASRMRSS